MERMSAVTGFAQVIHPYNCSGKEIHPAQSNLRAEQHFSTVPIADLHFQE